MSTDRRPRSRRPKNAGSTDGTVGRYAAKWLHILHPSGERSCSSLHPATFRSRHFTSSTSAAAGTRDPRLPPPVCSMLETRGTEGLASVPAVTAFRLCFAVFYCQVRQVLSDSAYAVFDRHTLRGRVSRIPGPL